MFVSALSIRYGKYCGIGHSGCPGEEPCDDLDACCKIHDHCVELNGNQSRIRKSLTAVLNMDLHEKV